MVPPKPGTVAARLTQALEEFEPERSIRAVCRRLADDGLYEATYSSIHRYFSGEVENPPIDFLTAVGKVLGVRAAYLAFGEEPKRGVSKEGVQELIGGAGELVEMSAGPAAAALLADVVQRLVYAQPEGASEVGPAELKQLAIELTWYPMNLPDLFAAHGTHGKDRSSFMLAALASLVPVIPLPGQGKPIAEVIAGLRGTRGKATNKG